MQRSSSSSKLIKNGSDIEYETNDMPVVSSEKHIHLG
jgi:hypothetical protein